MVKVYDIKTPESVLDDNFIQWCDSIRPEDEQNTAKDWQKLTQLLIKATDEISTKKKQSEKPKSEKQKAQKAENSEQQSSNINLPDLFAESFEMANI
ncbi:MAG: hypothetical protein OQJ89_06920, partial [Kangiellaceae bacterium]|nr:hypothetical protein [Kangiellaceae bacterium]